MDELLNKLLESELLNDETRAELAEAFKTHIAKVEADAVADAEVRVRADLLEKYHSDLEKLVEAVDTKVEDGMRHEIEELKEDISRFRDLEVEYAEKLVEARHEMAETVKADMGQLVETLDTFLEARMTVEFDELKESITEVKKINFGKKLFEAYANEFQTEFFSDNEVKADLDNAQKALSESASALEAATVELNEMKRTQKMTQILESLSGRPYEVMEAILKGIPTDELEAAYENFIPRVLHETAKGNVSEKESAPAPVLAEEVTPVTAEPTVLVTGDSAEVVTESVAKKLNPMQERLKRLAFD